MAENTREIVLDTLLEMERSHTYSHQLLRAVLDKYDYLEAQEKRFIKRLTEGCIERRIELDYCIEQYSTVPVRRMKPLIRCLLRMGAYQILYMDSVPDSAACNEAVKLAGKRNFVNLKGFVNGVLRALAVHKTAIPMPDDKREPVRYLSIRYSIPEWLIEMWMADYGTEDTKRILEGLMAVHPVSIRFSASVEPAQRQRFIEEWESHRVIVKKSPYLDYAYILENVEGVTTLAGYDQGVFTVQDVSSMLCVEAADIREGDYCMDVCAAPGGKTMLAAQKCKSVLARDVSQRKVEQIQENVSRMGLVEKVDTEVWDAVVTDERCLESADVLFLDVPCSGLGVMGKKRDIKYNVTPEGIESLINLQRQIIKSCWRYVKPGGTLVYSTCTINRRENEEMCRFIETEFPLKMDQSRQLMPGFDETDGFFYAVFKRI